MTKRDTPNKNDPLSEPTHYRRIWAAYLQRGYTRASWARALDAQYTSADRWDTGEVTMGLDTFMKACELLGYTPEELYYGPSRARSQAKMTVPVCDGIELDDPAIRQLLRELDAQQEERTALAQLLCGAGKYDVPTNAYVRVFVTTHAELRAIGVLNPAILQRAHAAALQVQIRSREEREKAQLRN